MIDVDDVRGLCADLADNSTGRSGAYELELRCRAARLLPAMLDEVERLRAALTEAVDVVDVLSAITAGTFIRPEEYAYARQKIAALKAKVRP